MSGAGSTLSTQLIKPMFYVKIRTRDVFIGTVILEIVLPPLLYLKNGCVGNKCEGRCWVELRCR